MTGNMLTPEDLQAERLLLSEGTYDEGNANCVVGRYRDKFAHNKPFGWMHYTGTHWSRDEAEAVVGNAVIETLLARLRAAASSGEANQHKEIMQKCVPNSGKVAGAMKLLSYKVSSAAESFITPAHLLNVQNGVVDLMSGDIFTHCPSQRFTSCAAVAYDPNADQGFWRSWLTDAVGEESADWLQMAVGYSLTGSTSEEVLFYLYGPSRSGKGTFTETILSLLGTPLAEAVPFDILTAPRDVDSQNFRLAPLHATRFVTASESNQYERFNEAKLKALTGGDSIQAAFKHHDSFTYRPQFKIWLSSNQPVNADPDDDAVWGRLRVIEFPNSHLGDENKGLKEAMRSRDVQEGIMAWAIQGAVRWYSLGIKGLPEPGKSHQIKSLHRAELDNVQAWIDAKCYTHEGTFTPNSVLYQNYEQWCKANGVEPKKQKGFSQALVRKGYMSDREGGERGFRGIGIR
jgi:putative DNA primase/helicase